MKRAKDYRAEARASLKEKWGIAILVTLIANFLGAQASLPAFNVDLNLDSSTQMSLQQFLEMFEGNIGEEMIEKMFPAFAGVTFMIIPLLLGALALSVAMMLIGPCIRWGLCRFRLALLDGEEPSVGLLFSGFKNVFFKALGLNILTALILIVVVLGIVLLGVLAGFLTTLVLPQTGGTRVEIGLIAALCGIAAVVAPVVLTYRYSMSFYALVDNPDMDAIDALRESKRMMKGNKWRLFCLQLSFIGWSFLCVFTCGVGYLWFAPYVGQSEAAFYHDVSRRASVREAVAGLGEFMQGL